jgi:hypothetical protein
VRIRFPVIHYRKLKLLPVLAVALPLEGAAIEFCYAYCTVKFTVPVAEVVPDVPVTVMV